MKQYGDSDTYERKLEKVMSRLGVEEYEYNWDRYGGWVQFRLKGELYRFEHSVLKARERGLNLRYGSDAFAQVVLSLEDIARMVERGIYELSTWVAGMRFLPPATEIPGYFKTLGFVEIPTSEEDVKSRYRSLAKKAHPDAGGSKEGFEQLKQDTEKALHHVKDKA